MTNNTPEVVAWRWFKPTVNDHGETVGGIWKLDGVPAFLPWWTNEPLIRLSDYERLQAETERLQAETERLQAETERLQAECAHYKNAIAEITTRHSVDRWANTSSDKELEQYLSDGIAQLEGAHKKQLTRLQAECRILEALAEALEWLRGAINCTPENDKHQSGAWISTSHPRIRQIDELLAAYRKGGDV